MVKGAGAQICMLYRDILLTAYSLRTTGIKVPPKQRDSEGFENPNDFFSSATKAPTTANSKASVRARQSRKSLDTSLASADMDVEESELCERFDCGVKSIHFDALP